MADKIYYGSYVFGEDRYKIAGGNITRAVSAVGEELSADEIKFIIKMNPPRDEQLYSLTDDLWSLTDALYSTDSDHSDEFMTFVYGTPIIHEHHGNRTKYYVKSIERAGKREYEFDCISAVGLLIDKEDYGGMFKGGAPFKDVVAKMLDATLVRQTNDAYYYNGIVPYSVTKEVGDSMLYEYLPIGTAQSNLNIAMFAIGADIFRDENLDMQIRFNKVNEPIEIPNTQNYYGGKVHHIAPATQVNITEHNFLAFDTDNEVVLFDNTATAGIIADNERVKFKNPCHDLKWNGEPLPSGWDNDVNYAFVSGYGVLTGKEYTHVTKVYEHQTGVTSSKPNVVTINPKYTMVGTANVAAVARRTASYCTTAVEMFIDFDDRGINPGDFIQFKSPYGEMVTGVIKNMNEMISGILKSNTTVECGWIPGDFGNDYNNYAEISADGTWTVPAGTTNIMLVLIGGAFGGHGGYTGQRSISNNKGEGGAGGEGGEGGRVFTQIVKVSGGETITWNIGEGGEGGLSDLPGTEGEPTTATINGRVYTSADGSPSEVGFTNFMTGETVALPGDVGLPGGSGNPDGETITYNGQSWTPGASGSPETSHGVTARGGYGGGAAIGANGGRGEDGDVTYNATYGRYDPTDGGGGDGGTATISPADATAKAGGGHGGFGGGGAGKSQGYIFGRVGQGGHGSQGSRGAHGLGYVFY